MINIFNNIIYYMDPFSKNKAPLQQLMKQVVNKSKKPTVKKSPDIFIPKPKNTKLVITHRNTNYLSKESYSDLNSVKDKYTRFSIAIYNIMNTNTTNPFLVYLFENKPIESKKNISMFPLYNIEKLNEIDAVLSNISIVLNISIPKYTTYVEHNEHLYLFFETDNINLYNKINTLQFFPVYDFLLEKKCNSNLVQPDIISLFKQNRKLIYLYDQHNIPFEIPITVLFIKNDINTIFTSFFGPLKAADFFNFYSSELQNDSFEYGKCSLFLKNTLFIFEQNDDIDYKKLLESYDSIFISKKVYTEKSTSYPVTRFIIKHNEDFTIL